MGRVVAVLASLAGILGTTFTIYAHYFSGKEDPQMAELLVQENARHKEVLEVLERIAKYGEVKLIQDLSSTENVLEGQEKHQSDGVTIEDSDPSEYESKDEAKITNCLITNPDLKIAVAAINIRTGPAKLSSLSAWKGVLKKGDRVKELKKKSSGPFGLGTDWIEVRYCDKTEKVGWISSKLVGGDPTIEKIR